MVRKDEISFVTLFSPYGFMPVSDDMVYVFENLIQINLGGQGYLARSCSATKPKTLLREVDADHEITHIEIDAGGCDYVTLPVKLCTLEGKIGILVQVNCVLHVKQETYGKVVNKYLQIYLCETEPAHTERRYFVVDDEPMDMVSYGLVM